MINNKFHLILDNEGYGQKDTDEILEVAGYQPRCFSVPAYKIQYIKELVKDPYIHLLCDYPMSINSPEAKLKLCELYLNKFRGTIRGIDFGPLQAACLDEDWSFVKNDICTIAQFCIDNRLNSRLILNIRCYLTDDHVHRIIDLAEQCKIGEVIVGDDIDLSEDFGDFMIEVHQITKNHSINCGILANCNTLEKAEILSNSPYKTILISFENILDLYKK